MRVDAYSYGGGWQSNGMLVLVATGRLPLAPFLFANVGEDSEHPDTLTYIAEVARPYAEAHGIELVEVQRRRRDGAVETLRQRLDAGSRAIPVFREKGGPPMNRSCTVDFKVRPIARELKRRGYTAANPAHVAIGISVDELERAKPGVDPRQPTQHKLYPLLDLGFRRSDCGRVIEEAGLPLPPKSACFFCPYHDLEAWRSLKRNTPSLFEEACSLEASMSENSTDGRPVYLTRKGIPLAQVVDDQLTLPGMDGCDSGWCMT